MSGVIRNTTDLGTYGAAEASSVGQRNVRNVTSADSPVQASANDYVRVDTSGGSVVVVLPGASGAEVTVIKVSSDAHSVLFAASAGVVNGPMVTLLVQWSAHTFIGVGTGVDVVS